MVREAADGKVEDANIDPVVAIPRTGNPASATSATRSGCRQRTNQILLRASQDVLETGVSA
jgi:hypothetical protein